MKMYKINFKGAVLYGSAVVIANDRGHAKRLLVKELEQDPGMKAYLKKAPFGIELADFEQIDARKPQAYILDNGDY